MEQKTKAWNTSIPADIGKVAGILTAIRDALNVSLGAARALANIKGVGGVNVTVAGANVVVDASGIYAKIDERIEELTSTPWELRKVTGALKLTVAPGMVNNFVPTIGGVSLAAVTPPQLTVTGASGQVYLDATVDGAGAITALIIASASSVPTDTSTQKRKLVGSWTASGGAFTSVTSILNTNQAYYRCGATSIWES